MAVERPPADLQRTTSSSCSPTTTPSVSTPSHPWPERLRHQGRRGAGCARQAAGRERRFHDRRGAPDRARGRDADAARPVGGCPPRADRNPNDRHVGDPRCGIHGDAARVRAEFDAADLPTLFDVDDLRSYMHQFVTSTHRPSGETATYLGTAPTSITSSISSVAVSTRYR